VLKFGSSGFVKGRLVGWAKPNVPNAGCLKKVFKKCAVEKKHRVGLSGGLPVVELKYDLYDVHLSSCLSCVVSSFRLAYNN
jgi:hypothetical protein